MVLKFNSFICRDVIKWVEIVPKLIENSSRQVKPYSHLDLLSIALYFIIHINCSTPLSREATLFLQNYNISSAICFIHPKGINTGNDYAWTNTFLIVSLFTTVIVFFAVQHLHNDCQHLFNRYENFSWNRSKYFMYTKSTWKWSTWKNFFLCLFSINLLIVFEKLQCAISRPWTTCEAI